MLIVTGTGRSGTSLIAAWLKKCGVLKNEAEWIPQFNAGFDNEEVGRINKAIWLGNDPYYHTVEAQTTAIKNVKEKVVKDTNFFYGFVADTWVNARTDIKFLICLRKFSAVHKSRLNVKQLLQARKPEDLETDFGKFLSKLVFNKIPFEIICFPDFMDEYDTVYKKVKELDPKLDISYETGKKIWKEVVDKTLVHY